MRLEYPLSWENGRACADILLRTPEGPVVLELKYWKRGLQVALEGEECALQNQGAHDVSRYDFVKGLVRIERLVAERYARAGAVLASANDPGY